MPGFRPNGWIQCGVRTALILNSDLSELFDTIDAARIYLVLKLVPIGNTLLGQRREPGENQCLLTNIL